MYRSVRAAFPCRGHARYPRELETSTWFERNRQVCRNFIGAKVFSCPVEAKLLNFSRTVIAE
jgi:hypothetical protein